MIKLENTKSLTRFELRSYIVGSTANEFIIMAFCYERAGLVAVIYMYDVYDVGKTRPFNEYPLKPHYCMVKLE